MWGPLGRCWILSESQCLEVTVLELRQGHCDPAECQASCRMARAHAHVCSPCHCAMICLDFMVRRICVQSWRASQGWLRGTPCAHSVPECCCGHRVMVCCSVTCKTRSGSFCQGNPGWLTTGCCWECRGRSTAPPSSRFQKAQWNYWLEDIPLSPTPAPKTRCGGQGNLTWTTWHFPN